MTLAAAALAAATATGCSPSREEPSSLTGSPTTAPAAPTSTTGEPTEPTTGATATAGTTQPAPNQQVISVTITNGTVNPPPATVDVKLGSVVVIEVTSDVDDEIHVHGYDITQPITAGQPARIEVQASLPGQWEVETHSNGQQLTTLRVQ
jgi:hypothetical protein